MRRLPAMTSRTSRSWLIAMVMNRSRPESATASCRQADFCNVSGSMISCKLPPLPVLRKTVATWLDAAEGSSRPLMPMTRRFSRPSR